MRKDNGVRKSISGLYSVYQLNGLNLDRFVNLVVSRGVPLFNVRKNGNKQITFCVNIKENKKFFAIINKLWYNSKKFSISDGQAVNLNGGYTLKRIRVGGVFTPFYQLYKRVGVLIGALLFAVLVVSTSDLLFAVDYSGSGYAQKFAVQEYLLEQGVQSGVRFSKIDLNALQDGILADNPSLSFVSCSRRGNRLKIRLEKAVTPPQVMDGDVERLTSTIEGKIKQLKVYRGRALLGEGDSVVAGDVIVDGVVLAGEEQIKVGVLASVVIESDFVFEYVSESTTAEDVAIIYAKLQLGEKNVTQTILSKTPVGEKTKYTVTLSYLTLLVAG